MNDDDDVSKILAQTFPHLRGAMQLLGKLDKWIGVFKADLTNGGNVEVTIRFKDGQFTWVHWAGREFESQ